MPRPSTERSQCTACGGWDAPGLYHPHTFCVLVRYYKGDTAAARMSLDAVLDFGRKLERLGLPNSAPLKNIFHADNRKHKGRKR